jgi:hypothetical protein
MLGNAFFNPTYGLMWGAGEEIMFDDDIGKE